MKSKNLKTNDNKSMSSQNLCNATKAVLRRNFIAIQSHLKEQEKNLKQPKLILEATRERINKTQLVERNHKDQNKNYWNRHKEKNSKEQWNKKPGSLRR